MKHGAFWGISVGSVRLDRWRVVSARIGPRLQGMHVLDMEKDSPAPETTGFDLQPILEHDCLTVGISSQKGVNWCLC